MTDVLYLAREVHQRGSLFLLSDHPANNPALAEKLNAGGLHVRPLRLRFPPPSPDRPEAVLHIAARILNTEAALFSLDELCRTLEIIVSIQEAHDPNECLHSLTVNRYEDGSVSISYRTSRYVPVDAGIELSAATWHTAGTIGRGEILHRVPIGYALPAHCPMGLVADSVETLVSAGKPLALDASVLYTSRAFYAFMTHLAQVYEPVGYFTHTASMVYRIQTRVVSMPPPFILQTPGDRMLIPGVAKHTDFEPWNHQPTEDELGAIAQAMYTIFGDNLPDEAVPPGMEWLAEQVSRHTLIRRGLSCF